MNVKELESHVKEIREEIKESGKYSGFPKDCASANQYLIKSLIEKGVLKPDKIESYHISGILSTGKEYSAQGYGVQGLLINGVLIDITSSQYPGINEDYVICFPELHPFYSKFKFNKVKLTIDHFQNLN